MHFVSCDLEKGREDVDQAARSGNGLGMSCDASVRPLHDSQQQQQQQQSHSMSQLQEAERRAYDVLIEHETFTADLGEMLRVTNDAAQIKEWIGSHLPPHDFSLRQKLRQTCSMINSAVTSDAGMEKSTGSGGHHTPGTGRHQSVMLNIQSLHVSSMNNLNNLLSAHAHDGDDALSERAASVGRISRVGSIRAGSFYGRKRGAGGDALSDVFGVGDEGSGVVSDALHDTYSLASKGSYRRRQTLAETAANTINPRRPRALSGNMDGMPNLNIDAADLRTCFSRPINRHTAVFTRDSDLEMMLDECNTPRIFDISSTEFNIFEEYLKYGNSAFAVIATNILLRYSFVQTFHFNLPNLVTFIRTVQSFYRSDNPFHNALHAADVMQTTHLYLCQRDVKENFSDVELFALLFAAMCIDVGHLGVNNQFLIKTRHPISTLYSDNSPMEAMHAALAFCILEDPECNFLSVSKVWDRDKDQDFRYLTTNFIFNSDHLRHSELKENVNEILSNGKVTDQNILELLSAILHAADISYLSKPRHIFLEWSFRMMAENYRQGEAEDEFARAYRADHSDVEIDPEARWLQISSLCDKDKSIGTELIRQMMELVVVPFLTVIRSVLPSIWIERMEGNFSYLLDDEDEKQSIILSGVQDHLWRKGIAPTWNDVGTTSGKNFLQVIRCWIATELPDDDQAPSPSKIAVAIPIISPDGGDLGSAGSQRPSNNADCLLDGNSFEKEAASSKEGAPFASLGQQLTAPAVGDGPTLQPTQKKRLSVSRVSTPGQSAPSFTVGLNVAHILTSEMLKHMHTLVDSNNNGSFDAAREVAIFATQWVKLLKDLEAQEGGPALLSSIAFQASRNAMSGSFSMAEEDDALMIVEMLRDLSSPVAYYKHHTIGGNNANAGERRPSFNELLLGSSPFAIAVLLTQMWWVLSAAVETNDDAVQHDTTPPDGCIDEDRSSQDALSEDGAGQQKKQIPITSHTLEYINASTQQQLAGQTASPLRSPHDLPSQAEQGRDDNELSSKLDDRSPPHTERTPPEESEDPKPPQNIEEKHLQHGVVQPHAPAPDPSPLKYILQRKGHNRPSPAIRGASV